MKRALRLTALVVALGAAGYWCATGANRGFTKTTVPVRHMDEVLGIEGITYEKRFVPGIEFLAAAELGACILAGLSFLSFNKIKSKTKSKSKA